MSIRSLDDLRPGDIMISGMSTAPTKLLVYVGQLLLGEQFRIGPFVAGHVGIISSEGKVVEAMPPGARERNLCMTDWSPKHAYIRLPEDYEGQSFDAAAVARAMIGTPYSLASYVYLAAYLRGIKSEKLAKRIDRRHDKSALRVRDPRTGISTDIHLPVEAICSVLVDQAWTLVGKSVVRNTRPQVVTPGMLTAQLWRTPGVIVGMAER